MRRLATLLLLLVLSLCVNLVLYCLSSSQVAKNDSNRDNSPVSKPVVYVVGKAAVADYLWHHILGGRSIIEYDGFYETGELDAVDFTFKYISGPGFIQTTIPQDLVYLVLVLNGRSHKKRQSALNWLHYLRELLQLKKTAVVILGDEQCRNDWILKYMKSRGGLIDVLFVVYDWKHVNELDIFQWPLGVATYRGFPLTKQTELNRSPRKYQCNFMGTVYANSSRSLLQEKISHTNSSLTCVSSFRNKWLASETEKSLDRYLAVLNNSDFTLCPVGKNTECYRIYEAMSYGSIPVVEDMMTPGLCESPLRLLKAHRAPVLYLKDWDRLDLLVNNITSQPDQVRRLRYESFRWYTKFKDKLRDKFIRIIQSKFDL